MSLDSDVCTDCGRVFATADLFRCGRHRPDEYVAIQLCIDCLYAVNPFLQRDLIESVFDICPTAKGTNGEPRQ